MKSARSVSQEPPTDGANRRAGTRQRPVGPGRGSDRLVSVARGFAAKIAAFELTDQRAADLAARWRQEIDAQERRVVEWFAPAKQAAFRAHAAMCRQENEALAPYREARRVLNAKLGTWQIEQERRTQAAQGKQQVDDPPAGEGTSAGTFGAAASPPQVEGVIFRESWRAKVIDKLALVEAIASRPELVKLIQTDLAALGHLARAHKGALQIPGVRVWCERIVAAARRH